MEKTGPIILLCLGILQLGTIRQAEDPILKTQTEPISYKAKLEETKDGVKGAPAPSMTFYGNETFYIDSTVEEQKDEDLFDYRLTRDSETEFSEVPEDSDKSGEPGKYWWNEEDLGSKSEGDAVWGANSEAQSEVTQEQAQDGR